MKLLYFWGQALCSEGNGLYNNVMVIFVGLDVVLTMVFPVAGELDCHLQPVGKEMFVCEEEEQWDEEEDEGVGQARPGTTKRKQYYIKKVGSSVQQVPIATEWASVKYAV